MEVSTWVSIIVSMACVLGYMVLNWVWLRPKRIERILRSQGFQGNPYRIYYGDTNDKVKMVSQASSKPMSDVSNDTLSQVYPFTHYLLQKYGRKSFTWNGPVPVVMISEPSLVREVFMKINDFQRPKSNPILKVVACGMTMLEGESWNKHRKLVTPTLHIEKLKLMIRAISASTNEMISEWEKLLSKTGSCELDALPYAHKLSADVISRTAFGSSFEEGSRVFHLITELFQTVFPIVNNTIYIPGLRFLPTKANRRIGEIDREIKELVQNIIIKKRQKLKKDGVQRNDDLLDILLEANKEHENAKNSKNICLTLNEVINQCKEFYVVGQESTSILIIWSLIMLGKHQDWQQKAREEVFSMFGNKEPDFDGIAQLKIVEQVVQEVLRLYPPVAETTRTLVRDIKLGDVFLPAGVVINLPLLQVHLDEKIWGKDAKEFNPARFSGGISKASGGDMSFFSFGWGPRTCIGINFAYIEAKMVLCMILQRFSFELSPSYAHAPITIGTLQPQLGAQIILKPLSA